VILFPRSAERDSDRLDRPVRERLGAALAVIEPDPCGGSNVKRLRGAPARFRLRVGDYRIVFDLLGKTLVVLLVTHRSEVYKRARRIRRGDLGAGP